MGSRGIIHQMPAPTETPGKLFKAFMLASYHCGLMLYYRRETFRKWCIFISILYTCINFTFLTGPSHLGHEDQPVLHRNVQRLEDMLINHVSHRLPGHQHPIISLGMMPHELCDKILNHLMKNKTLAPKVMQAFLSR